jgi:hypothetical protein
VRPIQIRLALVFACAPSAVVGEVLEHLVFSVLIDGGHRCGHGSASGNSSYFAEGIASHNACMESSRADDVFE